MNYNCQSICDSNNLYIYGICSDKLVNGQYFELNNTIKCVEPFIFDGKQCICKELYFLNGSVCFNLVNTLNDLRNLTISTDLSITNLTQQMQYFNQTIQQLAEQTNQNQSVLLKQLELHLLDNVSLLQNQAQLQQVELDRHILNNISMVYIDLNSNYQFFNQTNFALNSSINQLNLSLISNITDLKSDVNTLNIATTSNFSVVQQKLNQTDLIINKFTDQILDLQQQLSKQNQAALDPEIELTDFSIIELVCKQPAFNQKFDIQSVSTQINSSNFTFSYVFDGSQQVNNAFIDITDSSLVNAFNLYKTQSYYYNLKIQLGAQTIQSGSLISDSSIQSMNQVAILSKTGTYITIAQAQQFNILQRQSTDNSIRNLFVQLHFTSTSQGNISLIGLQNGILNIRQYQLAGIYYSVEQISLCALISQNALISITNLNFVPQVIQFGNYSSYLFSHTILSQIKLSQLVIEIGLSGSYNILTCVDSAVNQFQFGGIINYLEQSSVILKNSALNIYIQTNTQQIFASGHIIGRSKHYQTYISILNLCLAEQTQYQSQKIDSVGQFGVIEGKLSINHANIEIQVFGNSKFSNFGTIGELSTLCINTYLNNIMLSFNTSKKTNFDNSEINIAAIVGHTRSQELQIFNIQLKYCNLSAFSNLAGICGQIFNSKITCNLVTITESQLIVNSSQTVCVAGLFGQSQNGLYNISQTQIKTVSISSYSDFSSYSAGIMSQSYNDSGTIDNFNLVKSSIFSKAQQLSCVAACIASIELDVLQIKQYYLENSNIEAQSTQFQGTSSGCVATSNSSTVSIHQLTLGENNITSNSRFPISSALITIFNCGFVNIYDVKLININVQSFDIIYRNELVDQWGLSGMLLVNSTAQIMNVTIYNMYSNVECKLLVSASALISYNINCTLYISQIAIYNSTINANSVNTLAQLSVLAAGIIGIDNYLNYIGSQNGKTLTNINNIKIANTTIKAYSQFLEAYAAGIHTLSNQAYNHVSNINIINTNISCSGIKHLRNGGIYAVLYYSFSKLNDISIISSSLNADTIQDPINAYFNIYSGYIMGTQWIQSNIELFSTHISNSNISITGNIQVVYAACLIGFICGNTSIQDIQISNIFMSLSGTIIVASAVISNFDHNLQYMNYLTIYNMNVQTVTILTQNSVQNQIKFIASSFNSLSDSNITITIKNSMSLGHSSVNGNRIQNCDQLQILDVNNVYQVTDSGC
ncbi:Hypothetical_protein [Hexamita inflata]|uniref:Hypothetical_protein n=1 Tax=Hexamita inflata TaxID=28002 RepID=A0ABP1LLA2_9EUKA